MSSINQNNSLQSDNESGSGGKMCVGSNYFQKVKKVIVIMIVLFNVNLIIKQVIKKKNKLLITIIFISAFSLLAPMLDFIGKGLTEALCVGVMFALGMSFLKLSEYSSTSSIKTAVAQGLANLQKTAAPPSS